MAIPLHRFGCPKVSNGYPKNSNRVFAPIADELAGHPCKQTWFSAADREMQAETFAHLLMKELMALAAGLPTIFQDREDVAAGGFASYWLCQRHTSWQRGSPDDEQVEA
jgi:hypothetical protein